MQDLWMSRARILSSCRRWIVVAMGSVGMAAASAAGGPMLTADAAEAAVKAVAERPIKDPANPAEVSQACLAATAAMRHFPQSNALRDIVMKLSDALVDQRDLNKDGRVGWGISPKAKPEKNCTAPGTLDAFGDGTCNPLYTEYTFDTGTAAMCLAQAYDLTHEARYKDTAVRAMDDSWNIGRAAPGCDRCWYYWYSYSPNDVGRYVRNTNALMGDALAWTFKITGNEKYRARASAVGNAELREIKEGNDGYFGVDDPRFQKDRPLESHRIENHVPWVAKGLKDMGVLLGDRRLVEAADHVQDSWQFCKDGKFCRPVADQCNTWAADSNRCMGTATLSPCFYRGRDDRYRGLCETAVRNLKGRPNAYQLWSILSE